MLIVGGGPAGLFLAARLAAARVHTLVCEEHQTLGDPVHCTGVLSTDSFQRFELPTEATLNTLTAARFVSPSGIAVEYSTPTPLAIVIDRPVFDRALALRAVAAGAEVRSSARVTTLEIGPTGVRAMAGQEVIHARLAVLACGANYSFQRRFGLGLPRTYLQSAQRELPVARAAGLELHFGQDSAPSGFAWSVPVSRPDGPRVRVGVMTSSDAVGFYRRMVSKVADRWGVADQDLPPRQKILPLGAIERTYGDRLLAVGDAAGLVKPTTGGGIHYSILSASLAAEVAVDALGRDRLDSETLSVYERRWRAELGDEFKAQHALRDAVTRLSDRGLDSFFEVARTDGLMPIVRATARFNEHRPLIRALFKHPPSRRILFRSFVGA